MKNKYLRNLILGLLIGIFCGSVGKTFYDKIVQNKNQSAEGVQTIQDTSNQTGWYEKNNNKYYYINGEKQTAFTKIDNKNYYLTDEGKVTTGWVKIGENWYFFDSDGAMITDSTVSGCYLNAQGLIDDDNNPTNVVYDNIKYRTYKNSQYNFSIKYPSQLIPNTTESEDSRMVFCSDSNYDSLSLSIYGRDRSNYDSLQECFNNTMGTYGRMSPLPDTIMGDDYFIFTWETDGTIVYEYTRMTDSVIVTFNFSYPSFDKYYYEKMVKTLVNTLEIPSTSK